MIFAILVGKVEIKKKKALSQIATRTISKYRIARCVPRAAIAAAYCGGGWVSGNAFKTTPFPHAVTENAPCCPAAAAVTTMW